jgi:hypothetical protein
MRIVAHGPLPAFLGQGDGMGDGGAACASRQLADAASIQLM